MVLLEYPSEILNLHPCIYKQLIFRHVFKVSNRPTLRMILSFAKLHRILVHLLLVIFLLESCCNNNLPINLDVEQQQIQGTYEKASRELDLTNLLLEKDQQRIGWNNKYQEAKIEILRASSPIKEEKEEWHENLLSNINPLEYDYTINQNLLNDTVEICKAQQGVEEPIYNITYSIKNKSRKGFKNEDWFREILFEELSANYELGVTYDDGDCFFDGLAQWLNKVNDTDINNIKYLRSVCHNFYLQNKELVDSWNEKDNGGIDYSKVQYTAEECEQLFNGKSPIWGRQYVEGRILCNDLELKGICVIEILQDPDTGNPVLTYHWVDKKNYKSSINEEKGKALINQGDIPVLINVQGNLHFVPLWKKQNHLDDVHRLEKGKEKVKEIKIEEYTPLFKKQIELNLTAPSYVENLLEDCQQQKLRKSIIDQLAQPAYYQRIKLELYKHFLNSSLTSEQKESLSIIIKRIAAPEKRLRLGGKYEIREKFRANPSNDHELFTPLKLEIQQLFKYKEEFIGTSVQSLLEELITQYQQFIVNLVEQVRTEGPTARLELFEPKALLQGEEFEPCEVDIDKAYQLTCYNPQEYEYLKNNTLGLSIGSIQEEVYYKIDEGRGLLRPAKEHAVYTLYQGLGLADLVSPTHLIVLNGLAILPPDLRELPERQELIQRKKELKTSSSQEVFNYYPQLEYKIQLAQKERPLFMQGSLLVPGINLEKFLEKVEQSPASDAISMLKQLDQDSFSGHVLASLLLMPTDYKADNLIVDEQSRIVGIDNDEVLEVFELSKINHAQKHAVNIKNILYTLPLMNEPVTVNIREKFLGYHPALLLLNWLVTLLQKQSHYIYLLEAGLIDSTDPAKFQANAKQSLGLPLEFVAEWITGMYERFVKIQELLRNNSNITHQEIFGIIHPFASRYYRGLEKLYSHPLDQIVSLYKREKYFEQMMQESLELEEQKVILEEVSKQYIFSEQSSRISIVEAIKELGTNINLEDYDPKQQLALIDKVAEVDIWPDSLHNSWYDPQLLIRLVQEGASERVIKVLLEKVKADIKACTETGETILHASVKCGGEYALRQIPLLLQLGAELEAQDNWGNTPLDKAVGKKEVNVFKLLVELGAGEKSIASKINHFYQELTSEIKLQIASTITKLIQVNPKLGWKISLDELFPILVKGQESAKVLRTVTEGDRCITAEIWDELFDKEERPQKTNIYGIRSVPFLEKNGYRIYVKFYPQLPGTELAVIRLAENLLGYCAPYSELATIGEIPVLLTQGIPGLTLYETLKNHPERLTLLDPDSVSKALILTMLTNPADGNLGNYIISPFVNKAGEIRYRLICIDNDQAFMPGLAKSIKTGFFTSSLSLQVKTALYCLDIMKNQVNTEVAAKIRNLDLIETLINWLSSLKIYHQSVINHFDIGLIKKYQQAKVTVLGVAFAPGMIRQLFTKLMRLQTALNKKEVLTHLELLEILEPFVARRYRSAINETKLNVVDRFKKIENISQEQALTNSSNALSQLLASREIPEMKKLQSALWTGQYGPDQALKELQEIKQEHINFHQILKDLGKLKVERLRNSTTGITERLLQEADLTQLSVPQQKSLLDEIKQHELRYVHLSNCTAMNGALLASFNLEHINKLDLSGCPNLGTMASGLFSVTRLIMPSLTYFRLDQSGISTIRLQAEQLKKMSARNCLGLQSIDLIAAQLEILDLRGTNSLSRMEIASLFAKFHNTYIYLTPSNALPQQEYISFLYTHFLAAKSQGRNRMIVHYLNQIASQVNSEEQSVLITLAIEGNEFAQQFLIKALAQGHEEAQYIVGQIYQEGIGLDKDLKKAAEYYIKAASRNHQGALEALRKLVLQEDINVNEWLTENATKGNSYAQYIFYQIGELYEKGQGIQQNQEKAIEFYIKAANQGHWHAFQENYYLAYASYALKNLALKGNKRVQKWLIGKAEEGDEEAQYVLYQIAKVYEEGEGIKKNEKKAVKFYVKAASQKLGYGREVLKELALKGNKLAQDWIIKEAKKGNEEAQYTFGQMYEQGIGVEKNLEKAAKWYLKRVNQKRSRAPAMLKKLALMGVKAAQQWELEEAEKGNQKAQCLVYEIGTMYEQGINVNKDENQAIYFYIRVAKLGHNESLQALSRLALKGSEVVQNWIILEAPKEDKYVQYTFGKMCEYGLNVARNIEKAAEWYAKSAEQEYLEASNAIKQLALQGSITAQNWLVLQAEHGHKGTQYIFYQIGAAYDQGIIVEKNIEKAAEWYIKSANQEYWEAPNAISELALRGSTVAQNWLVLRAELGDNNAQDTLYTVAKIYEEGIELRKDEIRAAELYIKVANIGYWNAFNAVKNLALKGNKLAQDWIKIEAAKGNREAEYTLGKMYEDGIGVQKDEEEAAKLYISVANQMLFWEDPFAYEALNRLALRGNNIAQSWAIEISKNDNQQAEYTLAQMYEHGAGVERDEDQAVELYIKIANQEHKSASHCINNLALQGNIRAQAWVIEKLEKDDAEKLYNLGQMYKRGRTVEEDINKAVELYIEAANKKHRRAPNILRKLALKGNKVAYKWVIEKLAADMQAQYTLGQIYEQGIGVEKNEEEAAKWYIKAANQGQFDAYDSLKSLAAKDVKLAQIWCTAQSI